MTRKILMLAVAAAFTTVSGFALAGANDGPKYPKMESHKQYTDKRNLDHNNAAPRYPVMATNKQLPNNRSVASTSATQIRPGQRVVVRHRVRYPVHATHRATIYAHHG